MHHNNVLVVSCTSAWLILYIFGHGAGFRELCVGNGHCIWGVRYCCNSV